MISIVASAGKYFSESQRGFDEDSHNFVGYFFDDDCDDVDSNVTVEVDDGENSKSGCT